MKLHKIIIPLLVCSAQIFLSPGIVHPSGDQIKTEENGQTIETTKFEETQITAEQAESSTSNPNAEPIEKGSPHNTFVAELDIEDLIRRMSLEEKVGQLFVIPPESLASVKDGATTLSSEMEETLQKYPVGGIIMFGNNINNPTQVTEFISALQRATSVPLFIAVDEEGGRVARLANNSTFNLTKFESAAAVGATGDEREALKMGQTIGTYLKQYGFNLDFAPVADVNTNPDNPVIGKRSFSSDAKSVALMASAMANGLHQQGVIPTFKHFPGHGDTKQDSHLGLAINDKYQAHLEECEWLPYLSLTNQDCVMMGHIALPKITGDSTIPASMSHQIVTEILRKQLGFSGVIVTDSLVMKGVTDVYGNEEAAVTAILAGCDILLMPQNLQGAFDAVITAVKDGRISEQRINESVKRILSLKIQYGIMN